MRYNEPKMEEANLAHPTHGLTAKCRSCSLVCNN